MSDHKFAKDLRHILHRDPEQRQLQGRMRLVTCHEQSVERRLFEKALSNSNDIILTTGCGLPEDVDKLPLRFPSLIVPGLQMMRTYHEVFGGNQSISYQVYQAGDFIKNINNVDKDKVDASASFMQSYLQDFTNRFFPDIAHKVHFDFKKNVDLQDLKEIKEFLETTEDKQAQHYIEQIGAYSSKDKKRGCAQTYAAANIFFNGMHDIKPEKASIIIPVGGLKEVPFFYLTSLYHETNAQQNQASILPVSFNCQQMPAYYPYKYGDLTIGDILRSSAVEMTKKAEMLPSVALQDFKEMLQPIGITLSDLVDLAKNVKNAPQIAWEA